MYGKFWILNVKLLNNRERTSTQIRPSPQRASSLAVFASNHHSVFVFVLFLLLLLIQTGNYQSYRPTFWISLSKPGAEQEHAEQWKWSVRDSEGRWWAGYSPSMLLG